MKAALTALIAGVPWTRIANAMAPCGAFVDVTVVGTQQPILDRHRSVVVRSDRMPTSPLPFSTDRRHSSSLLMGRFLCAVRSREATSS